MSGGASDRDRTIADFGEQWSRYTSNEGYYGSLELLRDWLEPLVLVADIAGKRLLDIGSGSGRIVANLVRAGAAHVTAVEPAPGAFAVLVENTREMAHQITYLHEGGESFTAPTPIDLAVSYGVLHHIPDPLPVVRRVYEALAPGGRFAAWLYGREGNGLYLAVTLPLRRVTTRLPHWALAGLSRALDVPLAAYARASDHLPLPLAGYMRNTIRKVSPEARRLIIYDQLNPAYAKYYTRAEAERLFADAGFTEVELHHRHGYSWTVVGTKR
jgi:SAM-dependent methyltransferase